MKLSQQSINNFSFINKNYKHILNYYFNKETKYILKRIYEIIKKSFNKYSNLLSYISQENDFIKEENYNKTNIVFPSDFNESDFPNKIIRFIKNNIVRQKKFSFIIKGRKINIYIGYEENYKTKNDFNFIIEKMMMWIHILCEFSSHKCSQELSIYIYMTSLKKMLPNKGDIIDCINANSAFTRSCLPKSEIVIYRYEEWFKVFIHETFHCFGLDFSHMYETNRMVETYMQEIFNVDVEILLFESYTEFWAELMNTMFFVYLDNPIFRKNYNKFASILNKLINYQRVHCSLIMNKILAFNDINYDMLIFRSDKKLNYKENTNVIAYYVIKTIMFINFNETILFFQRYNMENIFQFTHTAEKVESFCLFIKESSNSQLVRSLSKIKHNYNNNSIQMDLYDFK